MKKLIDIAKEILNEITVANPTEVPIPNGWTEQEVTAEDQDHNPENKDEPDYYEILNIYSAPMEGWDDNHSDIIKILKDKEGKYFINTQCAFSEDIDSEKLNSYYEAKKYAVSEMEDLMEYWDEEEDEDEEED